MAPLVGLEPTTCGLTVVGAFLCHLHGFIWTYGAIFTLKNALFHYLKLQKKTVHFRCIPNTFYLKKVEPLRNQHMLYSIY